jgi:hypothetical protein
MLDRLLQLMAEGGVHSYKDLTERLSITQPLLETMLHDLARLGYIRSLNAGCAGQCAACSETSGQPRLRPADRDCSQPDKGVGERSGQKSCPLGGCLLVGSGKLWALTDRGARAVSPRSV